MGLTLEAMLPHGPAQPHDRDPAGRDELVQGRARDAQELGRRRDGQQEGPLGRGGRRGTRRRLGPARPARRR
jgi:hypothetical protein